MAPVKFANACAACHLLTFDKRFDQGVPHDNPEVIHAYPGEEVRGLHCDTSGQLHEGKTAKKLKRSCRGTGGANRFRGTVGGGASDGCGRAAVAQDLRAMPCHFIDAAARREDRAWNVVASSASEGRNHRRVPRAWRQTAGIAAARTRLQCVPHARLITMRTRGFLRELPSDAVASTESSTF